MIMSTQHHATVLFFVLTILSEFNLGICSDQETKLINDLLSSYQKYSRPVSDPVLPLHLNITLTLKQIIDLDERNQLLKTNLWLEYYWYDDKLRWNTVSYKKRTCSQNSVIHYYKAYDYVNFTLIST